jgi:hypothetical protein
MASSRHNVYRDRLPAYFQHNNNVLTAFIFTSWEGDFSPTDDVTLPTILYDKHETTVSDFYNESQWVKHHEWKNIDGPAYLKIANTWSPGGGANATLKFDDDDEEDQYLDWDRGLLQQLGGADSEYVELAPDGIGLILSGCQIEIEPGDNLELEGQGKPLTGGANLPRSIPNWHEIHNANPEQERVAHWVQQFANNDIYFDPNSRAAGLFKRMYDFYRMCYQYIRDLENEQFRNFYPISADADMDEHTQKMENVRLATQQTREFLQQVQLFRNSIDPYIEYEFGNIPDLDTRPQARQAVMGFTQELYHLNDKLKAAVDRIIIDVDNGYENMYREMRAREDRDLHGQGKGGHMDRGSDWQMGANRRYC